MKIIMRKAKNQGYRVEYFLLRLQKKWSIEAKAYRNGKLSSRTVVELPVLSFSQCKAVLTLLSKHCVFPKTVEDVISEQLDEMPFKAEYRNQWNRYPQLRNQMHP